jgi:hypothetical protein
VSVIALTADGTERRLAANGLRRELFHRKGVPEWIVPRSRRGAEDSSA